MQSLGLILEKSIEDFKTSELAELQIFGNFEIEIFWNLSNWKFFEFSKFGVFGIVRIGKLRNFGIFFNWENQSLAPRTGNFGIVHPFDIPHYFFIFILFKFKTFEHSKYMIIYKIVNSWNVNGFPNCSILKIWCLYKYLGHFWNFQNWRFFELFRLQIF